MNRFIFRIIFFLNAPVIVYYCMQIVLTLQGKKVEKSDCWSQDKTRQDIYYRNITSTIVWHAVSKKTLVEACQINSITNQILYYNK